jgi:hypothetical protein
LKLNFRDLKTMFRKVTALLCVLLLNWTLWLGSGAIAAPSQLPSGQYPVQQASYDDVSGEYSIMLLDTPPGTASALQTADLQMARLTDDELAAGQKTYLDFQRNQAVMHLSEDFRIEYIHGETEIQANPQTGQPQTVVVRQESSFWSPFAGALAGQALGSLLFAPRYYVPPLYQPGGMVGYGGHGNTFRKAVKQYQNRYQSAPPAVQNKAKFRTTGRLKNTNPASSRKQGTATKSSGSGFGTNTLRSSGQAKSYQPKSSSFGSRVGSRSSFGSRGFARRR